MLLKQINAKLREDLYTLHLPFLKKTLLIGVDVVKAADGMILGFCCSTNQKMTKFYSKVDHQELPRRSQSFTQDDRENLITEKRTEYVASFVKEALKKY